MTELTTGIALSVMLVAASFRDGIADDEGSPPREDQVHAADSRRQFLEQRSEGSGARRAQARSFGDGLILFSLSVGAIALYLVK